MKESKFVKLTYEILQLEGLTSTDKIVLARRLGWGKKRYYQKVTTMADALNMPLKTVQKSMTKLKRLGYWPTEAVPTREGSMPPRGGKVPSRGGGMPAGGGDVPSRGGNKKSVSPMKTDLLLDSSLDNKLERNEIVGLDGSAATALKKLGEENLQVKETQKDSEVLKETEIGVNSTTAGEALNVIGIQGHVPLAVPLGADGRPLTRQEMWDANFLAEFDGKPPPYSEAQVKAGREKDALELQAEAERTFDELFQKRAG